jgi:uncharacterized membrane protein
MPHKFWVDMHGGSTHFPIALMIAAMVFDLIGFFWNREPQTRDLRMAAFYALMLAALATFGAVLSGFMISGWHATGDGLLAKHHLFVWPAFGLIVALAIWRLIVGQKASRSAYAWYLAALTATAVVVAIAGYWGGEMLTGGG